MPNIDENNTELIASFKKNHRELVGVRVAEWKGELRADIRIYVQAIGEDVLIPTSKGVSIPIDLFPAVIDGVRKLGEVMGREKVVERIPKSKKTEIGVGINIFRGQTLLYIRQFTTMNNANEMKPTKKGISVRVDQYLQLLEVIETLAKYIQLGDIT